LRAGETPGLLRLPENVSIPATSLHRNYARFAKQNAVDLTVVGPDDPLRWGCRSFHEERLRFLADEIGGAAGVVENLREGMMRAQQVPTAQAQTFSKLGSARLFEGLNFRW